MSLKLIVIVIFGKVIFLLINGDYGINAVTCVCCWSQ